MPGISGLDVLKKLKYDSDTLDIPVVMLTARSEEEMKVKAAQFYDEAYLTKPIDINDLVHKLKLILQIG